MPPFFFFFFFWLGHKAKCKLRQGEVILREEKTELQSKIVPELQTPRRPSATSPLCQCQAGSWFLRWWTSGSLPPSLRLHFPESRASIFNAPSIEKPGNFQWSTWIKSLLKITRPQPHTIGQTTQGIFGTERSNAAIRPGGGFPEGLKRVVKREQERSEG